MNGESGPEGEGESDKRWEHFLDVLGVEPSERGAFEKARISSLEDWYLWGQSLGRDISVDRLFEFDSERVIPNVLKPKLLAAWEWLDMHADQFMDDSDIGWFNREFNKLFLRETTRLKRAAERVRLEEENKRFKSAEDNQGNASSFAASGTRTMKGIATMPPVYYPHLVPAQVKTMFTDGFEEDFDAARVKKLSYKFIVHGTGHRLKVVPETDNGNPSVRSVQKQHLDEIAEFLNGPMTTERVFKDGWDKGDSRRSLADLGLTHGVSNSGSFPDGYFHTKPLQGLEPQNGVNFVVTSIVECKDTAASAVSGAGEAAASATAAAVEMARLGMPTKDVVVPVLSTTGESMQFSAVYMLEPSLPTVCFVTDFLHLSKPEDRAKAARIIFAMEQHAERVNNSFENSIQNQTLTPYPSIAMKYDSEVYHTKLFKNFFSCCGQGKEDASVLRLLHRTRNLADMPSVCLPIAIRLKDDVIMDDAILFEKLVDYKIGLPTTSDDRVSLVAEIESVVTEMHKRGVVHMDLYLSNIMWKKNANGTFSVRLVDFDAVHELGEKLEDAALKSLSNGYVSDFVKLGLEVTVEYDTLYLDMIKQNIDDEKLQVKASDESEADAKKRLDSRCTSLMPAIFNKRFAQGPLG